MDSDRNLPCGRGCPIRRPADQRALAPPRSFSQRATSFIASWRQGIHQMPLPQRLIAKPVARRDKPRSQQVSHEDALLALENAPPSKDEGSLLQPFSWSSATAVTDGLAARPDTPSSPCQRSKTLPHRQKPVRQPVSSPDRVAHAAGALFCIRPLSRLLSQPLPRSTRTMRPASFGRSAPGALGATRVAPSALATNARSAFARWWR